MASPSSSFCLDPKTCPFTVVVFPDDLEKVRDIQQLEGRMVEIKGTIQDHDGRAEIVLRHTQQLGESAFVVVPAVPTDYDVERRGRYSPGKYSHPNAKKTTKKQGGPISIEDSGEPQKPPPLMIRAPQTIPLRSSSSGYFVPRHTMPSFQSV